MPSHQGNRTSAAAAGRLLAACLLLFAAAAASTASASPLTPFQLAPFSAIHLCQPFSVHISPAVQQDGGSPYTLTIDAADCPQSATPQVAAALLFGVDNAGVLSVSMDTGVVVNTTGCASLRITLPPTQLREVHASMTYGRNDIMYYDANLNMRAVGNTPSGQGAMVYIAEGFRVPNLTATIRANEGQGDPRHAAADCWLYIHNLTTDYLELAASTCGCPLPAAIVGGAIREASVVAERSYCYFDPVADRLPTCRSPVALLIGVQERVNIWGSVGVVTPNATCSLSGYKITLDDNVMANQGACDLRLLPGYEADPLPCNITGTGSPFQAAAEAALQGAIFEPTCGVESHGLPGTLDINTQDTWSSACEAVGFTDPNITGLTHVWEAAAEPPPGPTAEQALAAVLATSRSYARQAAAGNETAAELIIPTTQLAHEDLDVLFYHIAIAEGGWLGALAAANDSLAGLGTRFGPRDSYHRAMAIIVNSNDTAALRTGLEAAADFKDAYSRGEPQAAHDKNELDWLYPQDGCCTGGKDCHMNYGGVSSEPAAALYLAAAFALQGGRASWFAAAQYACPSGGSYGCWYPYTSSLPPTKLRCDQLRSALQVAAALAPRLGYGSTEQVAASARNSTLPKAWLDCILHGQKLPAEFSADLCYD